MKDRIRAVRKHFGMNQTEFGAEIGMKQSTVTNYELGLRVPLDVVIQAICTRFNVDEHWLRTGEGEMFVQLDVEDELTQWAEKVFSGENVDFRKRFVRLLSKLNDSAWVKLEEYARMLVGNTETDQDDEERAVEEFRRQYRLEKEAGAILIKHLKPLFSQHIAERLRLLRLRSEGAVHVQRQSQKHLLRLKPVAQRKHIAAVGG